MSLRVPLSLLLAEVGVKPEDIKYVAVTVRFGKTMQRRPPYVLFMRWSTWPAERLYELAREAARACITLLRNESHPTDARGARPVLPLDATGSTRIAV